MFTILERTINSMFGFRKKNFFSALVLYLVVFLTILVSTFNAQSIVFDGSNYEIRMFEDASTSSKTKTNQTKVTTNSATKKIDPDNSNSSPIELIDVENKPSLIQESIKQAQSDDLNEAQINDSVKAVTFSSTQTLIAGKKSYSPILKETSSVKKTAGVSLISNINGKGKAYRKDTLPTVLQSKANQNISRSSLKYKSSNLSYSNLDLSEKEASTEIMESKSISFLPKTGMVIRCNESDSDEWIINFSEISNFQMVTKKCLSPEDNLLNIATFKDISNTQGFSSKIRPNEFVKLRNNPSYE
ncbi:hypothetical protein D6810_00310, partial [Candidatus Dojkabacteria bacterium]